MCIFVAVAAMLPDVPSGHSSQRPDNVALKKDALQTQASEEGEPGPSVVAKIKIQPFWKRKSDGMILHVFSSFLKCI